MSGIKHHLLEDLTWVDAKEYFSKNDLVLLPTGSMEQHGPHNPIATDFQIACTVAWEAAKRTGVMCLPGIPVGVSREHREFPGSLWVSHPTFEQYVKEVILSVTHHGAKKVIVVNGHGMNRFSLKNIQQELREKQEAYVSIFTGGPLARKIDIPDVDWVVEGHGGISETSLNIHIKPETVHVERAVDDLKARHIHDFGRDRWGPSIFPEVNIDMTQNGHYGRATLASKEIGEKLFEMRVQALVEHIEYMRKLDVKPIKPSK